MRLAAKHAQHPPDLIETATLSYALRRLQRGNRIPLLDFDTRTRLIEETSLPRPAEQTDELLLWIGDSLGENYYQEAILPMLPTVGKLGAVDVDGVVSVIEYLKSMGWVTDPYYTKISHEDRNLGLTIEGWSRFEALKRRVLDSRVAFMAMPFNHQDIDQLYSKHYKPTVESTGFTLRKLDEEPRAGLIDNRLRVEIRRSRFLIAELTHQNAGAYWEAGFAEGLGRPVIYSCEQSTFENKSTHFDTNHSHTIVWDRENLGEAAEILRATIQNTLLGEANMSE